MSIFDNRTAKQRVLKQHQLVLLFRRHEALKTNVEAACLFGETGIVVYRTPKNGLPHNIGLDLVTIHHHPMDCAIGSIAYSYECSYSGETSYTLWDTLIAGTNFCNSCELVSED